MNCISKNALTWLLSAVVLMGSLVPMAVGHAHVEGDRPHSHEADAETHDGQHHHNEDGSHQTSVDELRVVVGHLHVSFFGCDITLPSPSQKGSDEPVSSSGDERAVDVRLTVDSVLAARVDLGHHFELLVAHGGTLDRVNAAAVPSAISRGRPLHRDALPLRARGERSGVLLI